MKIIHLDENHPILSEGLSKLGFDNEFDYSSSKEKIMENIGLYDGLVIRSRFSIDKSFLDKATRLQFIARVGAGLENIDIQYAEKKKIHLISAPEGNSNAVGEHALGMLLSLFNKLNLAHQSILEGKWEREKHRGIELEGETVGIIGYGNMGKSFAKKLIGFNVKKVIFYDLLPLKSDAYAQAVTLEELQKEATVLSLHTPQNEQSNKMINEEFINQMENSFWLINTARGSAVITQDLVEGLNIGKVKGAALDVLEYEKKSFENLFVKSDSSVMKSLLMMKNVILSPHIAGWTVESHKKLAKVILEKIKQFKK